MKRLLSILLVGAMAASPVFNFASVGADAQAQTPNDTVDQARTRLSRPQQQALRELAKQVTELEVNEKSVPRWVMGDLGAAEGEPKAAAIKALKRLGPLFRTQEQDSFEAKQKEITDELGQTHVRVEQHYRGLRVIGGQLIVHLQKGRVLGVNGNFVSDLDIDPTPGLTPEAATSLAQHGLEAQSSPVSKSELVVFTGKNRTPRLAYVQQVEFADNDGTPQKDELIVDANNGDLLQRKALIKTAKFRKVYDANHTFSLPGTLRWQETSSIFSWLFLDAEGKGAAIGTGNTYDYYRNVFGRDSYNGAGAQLISSVHVGSNYNNAFWDSSLKQMAYGDGDGVRFKPLSLGLDVTAHELTHAVTDSTADLIYEKESGALNEAMSDIFAECTERYINGSNDWKIGAEVFTPAIAGDALRYMYNPTADGYSADYYPERLYPGACTPSNSNDRCGVHGNSGIANLAFYLLTVGGTHPRGKTSTVVTGIGMSKAQQIFYRALTTYMLPDDDFADARAKTIKAAADLYGGNCSTEARAVKRAWRAVGVGSPFLIDICDIIITPAPFPSPFPVSDGK